MSVGGGRGIGPRGLLALGVASWLWAACGETITQLTPGDVVELSLAVDSIDVPVGRTLAVAAQPLDSTRALLVGQVVDWVSRDAQVASVDEAGRVTGVAPGETWVVASAAGHSDSAHVTVAPPPLLVLSDDSVALAGSAGGAAPAPVSVEVTNGGGFALEGLAVDSTVYGPGAADWLSATLDAPAAPATLILTAVTSGVTGAGAYAATVWLSAAGADGSPASVTVTLQLGAGAAASLAAQAGDGQTATVGTAVDTPPAVLVRDAFGNPVEGAAVAFAVTAGGGSVTGGTATSDASGVATVGSWTLGTAAGPNELTATSGALEPVTFTATGEPGPAAEVVIAAGDGQSALAGSTIPTPPAVRVTDTYGNGLEGVAVAFAVTAGGGSATGTGPTTGPDGVAALGSWMLGPAAGTNTLTATAAGVATPATFTATAFAGLDAVLLEAGDLQDDTVAATLPVAYAVRVVDAGATGVEGVTVTWTVTEGGGSVTPTSVTDASGVATAVRVLGTVPGAHAAAASVGGLAPVTFTGNVTVGSPDHVEVSAGDGQSATVATAVATPPAVRVVDAFGNGIAGHAVTFAVTGGGGSVDPTTAVSTGADGSAAVVSWTLGTAAGAATDTLEATAAGLAPVTITASATA
ncbi:MAG TPA: hypothetical protein VFQ22_02050, partial [Longimicrobiales bacterium]|nr:hypothetical protein [Longimicrobiales bacterium]